MNENISTENRIVTDIRNLKADLVLNKYAAEIRRLGKRVKEDVVAIGRYLDEARTHAGRGAWHLWINAEFGWSDQTARRFIHVYELSRDAKFNNLLTLDLPLSGLYQLAAPNTPDAARTEIAERLEAGEKVSCTTVTEVIAGAKQEIAGSIEHAEVGNDDDLSIAQRRAQHAQLFAEHSDSAVPAGDDDHGGDKHGDGDQESELADNKYLSPNSTALAVHTERIRDLLQKQEATTRELIALEPTEEELIVAIKDSCAECDTAEQNNGAESAPSEKSRTKPSLLEAWEATLEERQLIRDLVLEEYFAHATGAEVLDRIPAARRDEVVRAFLDKLTVAGMCAKMSEDFGQELRRKKWAPQMVKKSAKKWRRSINLTANRAH